MEDHTVLTECPLCRSHEQKPWRRKDGYDVVECVDCGFIYVRDYPSADFLRRFYAPTYANPSGPFQPTGDLGRKLKYWLFKTWIRRFFPKDLVIQTLEIGCGQGDFLGSVKNDSRFEARGLDYAEAPLEYARSQGLQAEMGDVQTMGFDDCSFDLVVALHVIEHVHDVQGTLDEIYRILKPGGLVFIVCPCVSHIKAKLAGDSWKYLGPPGHLWYFSPKTLSQFLKRVGFSVLTASCVYHRAHVRVLGKKSEGAALGKNNP